LNNDCTPIERELALLEEFNRSHSVTSLAQAMAARLGQKTRSEDLIAEAGLAAAPRDAHRPGGRAGFSAHSRPRV